jgi:hypothetical protein
MNTFDWHGQLGLARYGGIFISKTSKAFSNVPQKGTALLGVL